MLGSELFVGLSLRMGTVMVVKAGQIEMTGNEHLSRAYARWGGRRWNPGIPPKSHAKVHAQKRPFELQRRVRRLDTSLEATNTVPNHRAIPLLGQSCHRLLRPYNLIFGVLDAPNAQVIITEVKVQARSEPRCRGNSDGCEVTVLEVCELCQGLLVPMSLALKILLLVGQVVRQHAPLGMVFFDRLIPALFKSRLGGFAPTVDRLTDCFEDWLPIHAPNARREEGHAADR